MATTEPPLTADQLDRVKTPVHEPVDGELPPPPDEWRTKLKRLDRSDTAGSGPEPDASRPADVPQSTRPELADENRPTAHLISRAQGAELEPHYLFYPDGRRPYFDLGYPWRCVVDVLVGGARVGDGVMIGPQHVLTASHILDWTGTKPMSITNSPLPGLSLGTVAATWAYAYTQLSGIPDATTADEDYAVLVLKERAGDRWGWLGAREYHSTWDNGDWGWINLSHAAPFGLRPTFQTDFKLDALAFDAGGATEIWSDTMDAESGMSGSPNFGWWEPGPYVVSVHVAGVTEVLTGDKYNASAGGSDLKDLVKWCRANYP